MAGIRWISAIPGSGKEARRERDVTGHGKRGEKENHRKRAAVRIKQLPHDDPAFLSKLENRRRSATPELAKLRAYTLANRGGYDLTTLSTLYAAAGMLKYASATIDQVYTNETATRPTVSQWIQLLEAGRQARDPLFARDMMQTVRQRDGKLPSKRMQQILLNTYAESGLAKEALQVYGEMATRHGVDVSMAMAVLKACIRQRDLSESFVDNVVALIEEEIHPLPRRVMSMVLMAYASRDSNTVDRCFELAASLESLGPLRARDLLALLRACRESGDVARGDDVLRMIDHWRQAPGDGMSEVGERQGSAEKETEDGNPFDVSLATEICRAHFVAGRVQEAKRSFEAVPFEARDLALYNVMVDSLDDRDASRVFEEAWRRGLFGRRRRKLSGNESVAHIDVHRLGLGMAERAIGKHLEELREQRRTGGSVKVAKLIVGKGKPNPNKMKLCEHVRYVLYKRGVVYREKSPCVFTVLSV